MDHDYLLAGLQPLDCFERIAAATELMERHLNSLVDIAEVTYEEMSERAELASQFTGQPAFYDTAVKRFLVVRSRYHRQFADAQHCGDCLRYLHKLHDAALRSRHLELQPAVAG